MLWSRPFSCATFDTPEITLLEGCGSWGSLRVRRNVMPPVLPDASSLAARGCDKCLRGASTGRADHPGRLARLAKRRCDRSCEPSISDAQLRSPCDRASASRAPPEWLPPIRHQALTSLHPAEATAHLSGKPGQSRCVGAVRPRVARH